MGDDNDRLAGCAGIYVDMENLLTDGHAMVQELIGNWPDRVPGLARLSLYVRADHVELWKLWATSRFPEVEVMVYGTQHLSMSSSKNSADIAMATHAMADLVLQRVTHVVVFSDDSDFISLYVAIWDDPGIPMPEGKVPFCGLSLTGRIPFPERSSSFPSGPTAPGPHGLRGSWRTISNPAHGDRQ